MQEKQLCCDLTLTDPIFGLTLWLQCKVRGNTLWAFNNRHLNEIADYVASALRERQTTDYTTRVEKLPGFIKDKKNRASILNSNPKTFNKINLPH